MHVMRTCERLTYVAVDGSFVGHHGAVDHRGIVQILYPERVVPVLPKVEGNPEMKNNDD